MKAVILAAGMGKRLEKANIDKPKSMINFGNKSIIQYQIESCLENSIDRFIVVVGYQADMLKSHVLNFLPKDRVTFVENPIYQKTNTLYSLWLTRKYLDDNFIYFNADVLFDSRLLPKIVNNHKYSELLVEMKECAQEEVKVILDEDRRIRAIGKQLPLFKCSGEFVGVGKFVKATIPDFINYLHKGVENGEENNYFEYAVNLLSVTQKLYAVPTDNLPCIEIDFPEDLKRAKEKIFPKIKTV